MAKRKIPSRKFPKTKKKIPSRKFPTSQRKIPSRKFAKAPDAADKQPDAQEALGRPTNEEERQAGSNVGGTNEVGASCEQALELSSTFAA
jgi:hypothetical protein